MATTNMTAIPAAGGFIGYCLDPQEDKGKKERVQFVHSTFVDPKTELKLFAGRDYDGIDFRISFSPDDKKLNEKEFKAFSEDVSKYLGDRNYIAVCHNDTEHQHIHIISTFLDSNSKALNFAGRRNAQQEAIRRQEIVDAVCRKYGLSVLQKPENGYNTRDGIKDYQYKKERITKAEKNGKQPEKAELRKLINNAQSIDELEKHITRETPNSLTFSFRGKKFRLDSINKKLKNRADLERYINNRIDKQQSSTDRLRQSEQLFINRLAKTIEAMKYQGMDKKDIQNRINNILSCRANGDTVSERWEALKQMRSQLDRTMTREQLKQAKNEMYRQSQLKRHQGKMLKRALYSRNPIAVFVASIAYIINSIAQQRQQQYRHGDINRDGVTETREQELLKDILKQPTLKPKPEPEPNYNRPAPGR